MSLNRFYPSFLTIKEIQNFLNDLRRAVGNIDPHCEIYLFGSAALGKMSAESDLDVAVIVNNHDLMQQVKNAVFEVKRQFHWPVDLAFFYAPDFELKSQIGGLAMEVKQTGIKIDDF